MEIVIWKFPTRKSGAIITHRKKTKENPFFLKERAVRDILYFVLERIKRVVSRVSGGGGDVVVGRSVGGLLA